MPEERQIIWKKFNEKYNQYFKIDNKDLWKNNLQYLKKIIDTNNKKPTEIKYTIKDKFVNDKEKKNMLKCKQT